MSHNARLVYPKNIHIIFRSSYKENEYFGLDKLELKKLNIIQAKFGCTHCFHTIPDKVMLNLYQFKWNKKTGCFEINMEKKVNVQLNTLEESIVHYVPEKESIKY